MPRKINNDQFVQKSRTIHGDLYNYSQTNYIKAKLPVTVSCKKHGNFNVTPDNHLRRKSGCPFCANEKRGKINSKRLKGKSHNNFKDSLDRRFNEFLEKSHVIHKNKYDYSLVRYRSNKTPIYLICKKHGKFKILPLKHTQGSGCPKCAIEARRKTQSEFVNESTKLHNNKYQYSKVNYINTKTKVLITCPKHGEFLQSPLKHLSGHGCSICKESHGEREVAKYLDSNNIRYQRQKAFTLCRNPLTGYLLYFDFYINKIKTCIEFDGEQHYKKRNKGIFKNALHKIQYRDKIKDKFCLDKNIELIRIPYFKFDSISKILDKKLRYNR
jgi:hypothetical protein